MDWFQIRKGVSQGHISSPCLYNLYAQYIMRNAGLEEAQAGIKIARWNINNLRYAMAPLSSTVAWKIPWMEEPGRLQSMGSLRVGHNWATSLSLFTSCIGEGNGNPLQCSCLENPRDGGDWWAAIYGDAQSWTRLKQLSSSSSSRQHIKKQRHDFANKGP